MQKTSKLFMLGLIVSLTVSCSNKEEEDEFSYYGSGSKTNSESKQRDDADRVEDIGSSKEEDKSGQGHQQTTQ